MFSCIILLELSFHWKRCVSSFAAALKNDKSVDGSLGRLAVVLTPSSINRRSLNQVGVPRGIKNGSGVVLCYDCPHFSNTHACLHDSHCCLLKGTMANMGHPPCSKVKYGQTELIPCSGPYTLYSILYFYTLYFI